MPLLAEQLELAPGELALRLLTRALDDLNDCHQQQQQQQHHQLIVPFNYSLDDMSSSSSSSLSSWSIMDTSSAEAAAATAASKFSSLATRGQLCDSSSSGHTSTTAAYHITSRDSNEKIDTTTTTTTTKTPAQTPTADFHIDYYYHTCLVDVFMRTFARNVADKCTIASHALRIMPDNAELVKLRVNYGVRVHGTAKTLQTLFDHLSVHAIDDEHLWIL